MPPRVFLDRGENLYDKTLRSVSLESLIYNLENRST